MKPPSFSLTEQFELDGDTYSWRLKDSEIRYRGSGRFEGLINQRIPVTDAQLESLNHALALLDVWHWRND